ncbi:WhiB family transcriptional regulator [Rhodococcus opacus]|jgi:WhiB family redox-sensing transcriptional regulator|uniref:Transcriptional regulator WhiB n=1 Tax=Rhodococcus opacus TaxID=37919 RepID=A0AAX3YPF0_RHOOP|nr:WhiB family transcriptional regulator [Rhodococcus opacus]MCZ4587602.1 WhiB family transcriptional regulator [Rhodococcus opacus]WLF51402.1 WhiB family transcriptional regulator [Rhodococcus opacus]
MRDPALQVLFPQPRADQWEWQLRGACRSMPISMFFPARGLRGHARSKLERAAKLVCQQCPVIERCLRHALETSEPYGVWGGLTSTERVGRATALATTSERSAGARRKTPSGTLRSC